MLAAPGFGHGGVSVTFSPAGRRLSGGARLHPSPSTWQLLGARSDCPGTGESTRRAAASRRIEDKRVRPEVIYRVVTLHH